MFRLRDRRLRRIARLALRARRGLRRHRQAAIAVLAVLAGLLAGGLWVAVRAAVPPAVLAGGAVDIDQTGVPGECQPVVFVNLGAGPADNLAPPRVSGDYRIGSCPVTTCQGSLPPGGRCRVWVQGRARRWSDLSGAVMLSGAHGVAATRTLAGKAMIPPRVLAVRREAEGGTRPNTPIDTLQAGSGGTGSGGAGSGGALIAAATGLHHSCSAVKGKDGNTVWCWGRNDAGQLGDGTTLDRAGPVPVSGFHVQAGRAALALGVAHGCALADDGYARCWGDGYQGEAGDGTLGAIHPEPVVVRGTGGAGFLSGVAALGAGAGFSCALAGGRVWCWGDDGKGELGDGSPGPARATPAPVKDLAGVTAIALGGTHACAIAGGAWCWGDDQLGQLGDGHDSDSAVPVAVAGLSGLTALAAGDWHSCAAGPAGLWCWGGKETHSSLPVAVGGDLAGVTALAAGPEDSCALTADGISCWGRDIPGDGAALQSPTPLHRAAAVAAPPPPLPDDASAATGAAGAAAATGSAADETDTAAVPAPARAAAAADDEDGEAPPDAPPPPAASIGIKVLVAACAALLLAGIIFLAAAARRRLAGAEEEDPGAPAPRGGLTIGRDSGFNRPIRGLGDDRAQVGPGGDVVRPEWGGDISGPVPLPPLALVLPPPQPVPEALPSGAMLPLPAPDADAYKGADADAGPKPEGWCWGRPGPPLVWQARDGVYTLYPIAEV